MRETSAESRARFSSRSRKERNESYERLTMSDNDKWVWSNDDDPIAALFRPEPSSKAGASLQIDLMSPESAKTPAASAALGNALALHLQGKTEAALKELSSAIESGENLAELHAAMGH